MIRHLLYCPCSLLIEQESGNYPKFSSPTTSHLYELYFLKRSVWNLRRTQVLKFHISKGYNHGTSYRSSIHPRALLVACMIWSETQHFPNFQGTDHNCHLRAVESHMACTLAHPALQLLTFQVTFNTFDVLQKGRWKRYPTNSTLPISLNNQPTVRVLWPERMMALKEANCHQPISSPLMFHNCEFRGSCHWGRKELFFTLINEWGMIAFAYLLQHRVGGHHGLLNHGSRFWKSLVSENLLNLLMDFC